MPRKYTSEEHEFLLAYIPGHTYKETCKAFNEKFDPIKESQVRAYMKNHKIRNGLSGRFEKGHVPPNKGRKLTEKEYKAAAPTMFKPGSKPANTLPIGTEKLCADGYVWVKLDDKPKVPKQVNWKQKHILLWEEHNGPLPEGCAVKFLDDDKTNITIENLQLVTRGQLVRLNQTGLHGPDPEMTKAGIAVADLITKVAEAERKNRKRRRHK